MGQGTVLVHILVKFSALCLHTLCVLLLLPIPTYLLTATMAPAGFDISQSWLGSASSKYQIFYSDPALIAATRHHTR
jgi:hypothetical protein